MLNLTTTASIASTSVLNNNFQLIQDYINNRLLKKNPDSGIDNQMRTDLDMNSNSLLNVGAIFADDISIGGKSIGQTLQDWADELNAIDLELINMRDLRIELEGNRDAFYDKYFGRLTSRPITKPSGAPLENGDMFFMVGGRFPGMQVWLNGEWLVAALYNTCACKNGVNSEEEETP